MANAVDDIVPPSRGPPMQTDRSFFELINLARDGDQQAAADFVRLYEPELQRVVRGRLRDSRMRRYLDSFDVTQSVLATFFVRSALGQYDFSNDDQVRHFLTLMVRRKVATLYAKHRAQKRDLGRIENTDIAELRIPILESTPSQQVSLTELLGQFLDRMTDEERRIAEQRAANTPWQQVADEIQQPVDKVRIGFMRSVSRIFKELGLDEAE